MEVEKKDGGRKEMKRRWKRRRREGRGMIKVYRRFSLLVCPG